jgi:hypothetical protein
VSGLDNPYAPATVDSRPAGRAPARRAVVAGGLTLGAALGLGTAGTAFADPGPAAAAGPDQGRVTPGEVPAVDLSQADPRDTPGYPSEPAPYGRGQVPVTDPGAGATLLPVETRPPVGTDGTVAPIDRSVPDPNGTGTGTAGNQTVTAPDGSVTVTDATGTRTVTAPNGTVTVTDLSGRQTITEPDGTVTLSDMVGKTILRTDGSKIYSSEPWGYTTLVAPDGRELANGGRDATFTRNADGSTLVQSPNGDTAVFSADGSIFSRSGPSGSLTRNADGSTLEVSPQGYRTIVSADGQVLLADRPDGTTFVLGQPG